MPTDYEAEFRSLAPKTASGGPDYEAEYKSLAPPTEDQQHAQNAADYRKYQIGRRDALANRQQSFERNVLNPIGWAEYLTGQTKEAFSQPVTTIVKGVGAGEEMAGILPEGWSKELSEDLTKSPLARIADIPAPAGRSYGRSTEPIKFAVGFANSVKRMAEFLTSADGALLLAAGPAGLANPQAARALSGAYAVDMATHAPEQFNAAVEALERGDTKAAGEGIGGFLISAGGSAVAGRHALTKPGIKQTTTLSRYNPWEMGPKTDLSRWKRTDQPMMENPLPNVGEQPKPNENQIKPEVLPEPNVPVEQSQAQAKPAQTVEQAAPGEVAPNYHYASPESKTWWEKQDELQAQYDALRNDVTTEGSPERAAARKALHDHGDLAYTPEGKSAGLAKRRIDLNDPLNQVNTTASQYEALGQRNLTGFRFNGDWTISEDGRMYRKVVSADGKTNLVVWKETLHPLEELALEQNEKQNTLSSTAVTEASHKNDQVNAGSNAEGIPQNVEKNTPGIGDGTVPGKSEKGGGIQNGKEEKQKEASGDGRGGLAPTPEAPVAKTPEPTPSETKAAQTKVPEPPIQQPERVIAPTESVSEPPAKESSTPVKVSELPPENEGGVYYRGDPEELGGLLDVSKSDKVGVSFTKNKGVAESYGEKLTEARISPHKTLFLTKKYTKEQLVSLGLDPEFVKRLPDNPEGREVLSLLAKDERAAGRDASVNSEREMLTRAGIKSVTLSDQVFVIDPSIVDQSAKIESQIGLWKSRLKDALKNRAEAQQKLDRFKGPLIDRLISYGIRFTADENGNLSLSVGEKYWSDFLTLENGPPKLQNWVPHEDYVSRSALSSDRKAEIIKNYKERNLNEFEAAKSKYEKLSKSQVGQDIVDALELQNKHGQGAGSIYYGEYASAVDAVSNAKLSIEQLETLKAKQEESFKRVRVKDAQTEAPKTDPIETALNTKKSPPVAEPPQQKFLPKSAATKPTKRFPKGLIVEQEGAVWKVKDANTGMTLLRRTNEQDARNQAQGILDALQGKPSFSVEEIGKIALPAEAEVANREAIEDSVKGWMRHVSAPVEVMVVHDPSFTFHDGKPWSGMYVERGDRHIIALNSAAIASHAGAFRVFTHEIVGHFGLQQVLGDQYNARLDQWLGQILVDPKEGGKLIELAIKYGYADKDNFFSDQARRSAVEEYIATHKVKSSIIDRAIDWIKDAWLRLTGRAPTDTEIRDLLRQSRRYLKEGKEATSGKGTRYSLARTEEEARDIKDRTLLRNRQLEGESMTGQAADIAAVLAKHAGTDLTPGAAELLGKSDFDGVARTGRDMTGVLADYRALKAKYGVDSYDLVSITRPAATQMLSFTDRLKGILTNRDKEVERLSRPGVAKLLARESLAKMKALNAENVLEQSKAIFSSAHRMAEKALAAESKDDVRAAVLQGRLNQIDEMSKSQSALQQVVEDMVNVVSAAQGGVEMLTNPKVQARSLSTLYADMKKSTGQRLHSQALIDWASYILSKSAKLREQLLGAKFATDEGVKRLLDPYQAKFLSEYEADPVKAVQKALSMRGKLTTAQERAAYAWQALNARVLEQFKGFGDLVHAGEVAERVLADKEFSALRTEVLQDAKIKGRTAPYSYRQGETMVLPDATVLELSGKFDMAGGRTEAAAKLSEMERARDVLRDYVAEQNLDDPDYWTHAENLKMLDAIYMTDSVMRPKDAIRLIKTAFGTLNGVIARIGGRPAAIVTALVRNFEETNKRAAHWRDVWSTSVSLARAAAIDSHGFRETASLADANRRWNEEIGWELADSLQDPQGGLGVGDKTMYGHTITTQDMADVRTSSTGTTAAFGIVQGYEKKNGTVNRQSAGAGLAAFRPQLTKDTLGGVTYWRDALKGSEHMVPRGINEDRMGFAEKFADAHTRDDFSEMERLLNDNFGFVRSFVRDRRYQGATAGPFDGDSGAFALLGKRLADGYYNGVDLTFERIVTELSDMSSLSHEETRDMLLKDMGTTVSRLWRQEKPIEGPNIGRSEDTKNTFTRSRNDKIAPYWFYETGFKDQNSILGFAANISSHALDDVVNGMKVAITDIERQEQDLFDRAAKVGTKQAVSENAMARKNGETYDSWQTLQWRHSQLRSMIHDLTVDRYDAQQNQLLRRLIGVGIQSKLTSTPTTVRNLTSGPAYLGARLSRLTQSNWLGYAPAFYQTWIPGLFKTLYAVAKHEVIAKGVRLPQGVFKAVGQAARDGFALKEFLRTLGRDNLVEITDRLYDDMKVVREMESRGITFRPDFVKDYDSRFLVSMRDAGLIPGQVESGGREAAKTVLGAIELGFGADAKATHPFIGDLAINSAAYQAMMSSAGPFQGMQRQLARLYRDWISSGGKLRNFDFENPNSSVNVLSHKEVFPSFFKGGARLFSTESGYNAAMQMYQRAGIDFQGAAIRYLADVHAGKSDAMFMSEAERGAMTSSMIDWVNRSTVAGSAQALRKAHWINQLVAPFLSWPIRVTGHLLDDLQIASKDPETSRAVAAGLVALGVVLPFVVGSMATDVGTEEADRAIKRMLYNQTKATRQPWEREGTKSQLIGWALSAANTVPFLDKIMNAALNDLPTRGRQDFSLVAIETLKDISKYVGGVVQTGDVRYKLPELLAGLIPETKAIVNRLPGIEGNRESANVVALMRRHGTVELLRPTGDSSGSGVNVTGLTPYADRMVNAAMTGDLASFSDLYSQAVAKATELGRPNPEKLVAQLFTSRSPYNRAFKAKLTEEQRQQFLDKLSPDERATVEDTEQKFQAAAATLGKTVTFAKGPPSAGATGRAPARTGLVSASTSAISPSGLGRVRTAATLGSLRRASRIRRVPTGRARVRTAARGVRSARVRVPRLRRAGRSTAQARV